MSPTDRVLHGQDETQSCDVYTAGYTGTITLSCSDGALSASASCPPSVCSTTTMTDVELDGTALSTVSEVIVAHGASDTVACGTVDSVYDGDIAISCSYGNHTVDMTGCHKAGGRL